MPTSDSKDGGRLQPTVRMLSVSTGGTSVSDSKLSVSVPSLESREMVGCGAGIRLGDKFAVSGSVLLARLLPGFEGETEAEEWSATNGRL